ncbi:MAG TPA: hypothetical protein VLB32_01385 [Candidatus Acidoferrales bacterium]|nr:hypothetical protein [Candidatus Acidoferrales bacterium]
MKKILLSLTAILALALAPSVLAQGKGQGQGQGQGKGKPAETGKPAEAGKPKEKGKSKADIEKAKKDDEERERRAAEGWAIGKKDEKTMRDWFGNQQNLQGLPPGLAKRDNLPPGLQKYLEKNGTLPPGLQKRMQPLPSSLEIKLPKPREGTRRMVVGGNVVLVEERTSKILDIVRDVIR